jgi:hypothetical protein
MIFDWLIVMCCPFRHQARILIESFLDATLNQSVQIESKEATMSVGAAADDRSLPSNVVLLRVRRGSSSPTESDRSWLANTLGPSSLQKGITIGLIVSIPIWSVFIIAGWWALK